MFLPLGIVLRIFGEVVLKLPIRCRTAPCVCSYFTHPSDTEQRESDRKEEALSKRKKILRDDWTELLSVTLKVGQQDFLTGSVTAL